ncbi:9-O-acetyl-N-acetylneuraminate esterase [Fusobacterium mortiferum]|uniref:9-O-acetyl-N-acetylneuraminate esterase n=1 Tax=Fusobacterium mortiferum TaxID=850 RepID=A0A414PYA4_FUSMR|nr:AAA family ATPase [Fusobacterium mortiferum]RHF73568.1 9-O-acetyl-N-acetylneuraminate esterase [Fusobacterium mortiferum]
MRPIAIGVSDFRNIIANNCFYVDKTKFIEELVNDMTAVHLITRPRRFGKTLNLSMLKYFYDIEGNTENRKLFDGLYISNFLAMSEQGKYPVIFLSFKDVKADSSLEMMENIAILMKNLYDKFEYIREKLNQSNLMEFDEIWLKKDNANLRGALLNLCSYLKEYYNQDVILLIDEYDTPMVSAYEHGYYDEIKMFFTTLYGSALKENPALKKAVLTGIMRISKENIFSGLNNVKVNSILEDDFAEYFGITEKEVEKSLIEYGLEERLPEVQKWYNGYIFGGVRVYNPFSITNFLDRKKIMPYWVNTSSNTLINKVLKEASSSIFEELSKLFQRETINKTIDVYSNFNELKNTEQIWYLLTNAGYLTPVEEIDFGKYSIRIPNEEVHYFFERDFIRNFLGSVDNFDRTLSYLLEGDFDNFTYELENIMLNSVSCFDFNSNSKESHYHVFILGMLLGLRRRYYIHSNREGGRGRYDLVVEPMDKRKNGLVIEFKVAKEKEELEKASEEALAQIEEKRYYEGLRDRGIKRIILVGISFYQRDFKLQGKIIKGVVAI